jgi:hypothetical protein
MSFLFNKPASAEMVIGELFLEGLNRELAYIRNGIVAANAADFNIPVSSDLVPVS